MSRVYNPNAIVVPEARRATVLDRFTGAIGVVGASFKGRPSGQPLTEAAEEFRLAGISAGDIIEGLDESLAQAAAEHDDFTVTRSIETEE
jgi:hypothetical protein